MNLMYLRYFIVIADCLNYTEAAKQLYVSQPTLSYSIAALEKELGVKLFIRTRRSVSLTSSGEILYHIAKQILQLVDRAYIETKMPLSTELSALSIGFLGDFLLPYCFQNVISPFMTKYPNIRSNLTQNGAATLYDNLINCNTDIIISRSSAADDHPLKNSICKTLIEDFFCLVIAADHPYIRAARSGHFSSLDDVDLLLPDTNRTTSLCQKILTVCESIDFTPNIRQTNLLYESLLPMIACGAGVAVIPKSLVDTKQVSNIVSISLENYPLAANHIVAIWMKDNDNPSLQIFTEYLNKNF